MSVDFNLNDKVAVITGGSRGIGEAIARTFAERGAKVVISSRKQDALDETAKKISDAGGEATGIACHTGDLAQITELHEKVMDKYGKIDILVNNAATNPYFGDVLNISESQFDKTFDVNTKGYFFMAQQSGKIMLKQGKGNIINIASIAGLMAPPMQGVYGMTKAAVILMTKAYAKELGPFGIRCNAICPGLTETKFASVLINTKAIYDAALTMIPMKRHGQPDEIASAALYLASDASGFATGSVVVMDGGNSA
jgi:NAD(P)-dependent dehydrogenase (short-subunit alcohol dehydrogenase family)